MVRFFWNFFVGHSYVSVQSKNVTYLCCGTNDSGSLFLWVSKAAESLSLLLDKLWTSLLTLPWSQTLSLADDKRKPLGLIQNLWMRWVYQSWAYLLKPSVFRGFALVMLGRSAVNTHHRKAFWSTEFIVNGTCGRTCRNVISYIKSMLVFSYTSWVLNTWRDHPVPVDSTLVIHSFSKLHRG